MRRQRKTPDNQSIGLKTAKNSFVYTSSKIFAAGISVMLLIFLTRYFGPTYFGLYSIVIAFTSVLGMAGNFGLGTLSRKRLSESKEAKRNLRIISNVYSIALIASLVISLFGILMSGYIAIHAYHDAGLSLPLMVASITVFFSVMYNTSSSVLVGLDKVKSAAICNIFYSLGQLFFVVALVLLGYSILGAVIGIAIGLLLGLSLALAYIFAFIGIRFIKPDSKTIKNILGFSLPVMLSNVATTGIMSFAVDLLGIFVTAYTLGSYAAAFRLGRIFDVMLTSTTFVLLPTFSFMISSNSVLKKISKVYESSVFYMLLLSMPILILLIAYSKPLTYALFSSAYSSSYIYLIIISVGITLQVIGSFAGTLILSYGDTRKFMKYQIGIVVSEFALLLVFTPFLGVYGALISIFVAGPIIMNLVYSRYLYFQGINLNIKKISRLAIAGILALAILVLINIYMHFSYYSIIPDIIALFAFYPLFVGLSGSFSKENAEFLKRFAKQIRWAGYPIEFSVRYIEALCFGTTKK